MIVMPFIICAVLLSVFKDKLPRDKGRDFAYNGLKSAGKPRGAGIIIISAFVFSSLLFIRLRPDIIAYYHLILASMVSGFLDDRAKKPWGAYKKAIVDLIICIVTAIIFVRFNQDMLSISIAGIIWNMPAALFVVIATILLWVSINATNCCDGIDGLCGSLSVFSMVSIGIISLILEVDRDVLSLIIVMIFALLPYLWRNQEPSQMIMGDAGSRAIGLFLGIITLNTGNLLLFIPLCFMILCDGLTGIIKIFFLRFFKIHLFKNIRTPLHDHFRENKKWSNAQVIMRFLIIQIVVSAITIIGFITT
jgi:phospho-N-acetylmuramoyl-pentapeptide-transferase